MLIKDIAGHRLTGGATGFWKEDGVVSWTKGTTASPCPGINATKEAERPKVDPASHNQTVSL